MKVTEKKVELSNSGYTHLCCYAEQSRTFDLWLSSSEEKMASMISTLGMLLLYL